MVIYCIKPILHTCIAHAVVGMYDLVVSGVRDEAGVQEGGTKKGVSWGKH